jgi:thiamine-phosphate pyrophosphorylase
LIPRQSWRDAGKVAVRETETGCRLYVRLEQGPSAAERLASALAAADIASCLFVPAPGLDIDTTQVRPLVALAQREGVAALVAGNADLASQVRADGIHVQAGSDPVELYEAARRSLGEGAIIGVDTGISRHDAMTLAEAGADYVAFGAPARLQDRDKARARRYELVAWWAEIFEVPCVAFDVESADEALELARAGADFVAISLTADLTPSNARELAAAVGAAIGSAAAVS